jgi:hypothetical protein
MSSKARVAGMRSGTLCGSLNRPVASIAAAFLFLSETLEFIDNND